MSRHVLVLALTLVAVGTIDGPTLALDRATADDLAGISGELPCILCSHYCVCNARVSDGCQLPACSNYTEMGQLEWSRQRVSIEYSLCSLGGTWSSSCHNSLVSVRCRYRDHDGHGCGDPSPSNWVYLTVNACAGQGAP